MNKDKSKLAYCDCCSGMANLISSHDNPPGLSSIRYRVATYDEFRQNMHVKIGKLLGALKTRDNDDLTIGILDACATLLDILTFYQERIANEGFLNTATERRSVLELARSIGYELNPGVSATTFLSFVVESAQKDLEKIIIPQNIAVQTLPGQNELPQIFETDEPIEARPEWTELKPKLTKTSDLSLKRENNKLYLKGINLNLNIGDCLLLIRKTSTNNEEIVGEAIKISSVDEAPDHHHTIVEVPEFQLGASDSDDDPVIETTPFSANDIGVYALRVKASVFGHNAPDWNDIPKTVEKTTATMKTAGLSTKTAAKADDNPIRDIFANYLVDLSDSDKTSSDQILSYPDSVDDKPITMTSLSGTKNSKTVHLESVFSKILKDSWIVLHDNQKTAIYKIDEISEKSIAGFSLSSKVTAITVENNTKFSNFEIRNTTVYAQSEKLELADTPLENNPSTKSMLLDKLVHGLKKDQYVAITGEPKNSLGTLESSIISISSVSSENNLTLLNFDEQLPDYVFSSITINANVASASHGETKFEKLGSGDKTKQNLSFTLKQTPLTHLHTNDGIKDTLELRVNDILWKNTLTFNSASADDEVYSVRIDDDGNSHIIFGDGKNGKIPPTGIENISAKYRVGLGIDGLVKAHKISLLKNRPFGVLSVSNPVPSSGGDDPEKMDDARQNATKRILTMDRIVSIKDVEHYAIAFPGIGKAKSVWLWNSEKQIVHLTIASASGEPVDKTSKLYSSLKESLNRYKDPLLPIQIDTFKQKFFDVVARIKVDERIEFEKVVSSVKELLVATFSFSNRNFGQHATISEIMAVIQTVEGVQAVDVDHVCHTCNEKPILLDNTGGTVTSYDVCMSDDAVDLAELLLVNPNGITILNMTPQKVVG